MRGANGFVVQFAVTVACLAAVTAFFRRHLGTEGGIVAALCLASFPLFDLCMTSAGFDGLNFACLAGVMMATARFAATPTGWNLELIAHAILFAAGCRYESVISFLAPGCSRRPHGNQDHVFHVVAAGLGVSVLAPSPPWCCACCRRTTKTLATTPQMFSLRRVPENAANALELLLDWHNKGLPGSRVLVGLAAVGLLALAVDAVRKRVLPGRATLLCLGFFLGSLGILLTAHYSYYLGDIRQAFLMRLGLVHALCDCPLGNVRAYAAGERRDARVGAGGHRGCAGVATAPVLRRGGPHWELRSCSVGSIGGCWPCSRSIPSFRP